MIIVLRNTYGSTGHFEENFQAVLFDQLPRPPKPGPKDFFAHALRAGYWLLMAHRLLLLGGGRPAPGLAKAKEVLKV